MINFGAASAAVLGFVYDRRSAFLAFTTVELYDRRERCQSLNESPAILLRIDYMVCHRNANLVRVTAHRCDISSAAGFFSAALRSLRSSHESPELRFHAASARSNLLASLFYFTKTNLEKDAILSLCSRLWRDSRA